MSLVDKFSTSLFFPTDEQTENSCHDMDHSTSGNSASDVDDPNTSEHTISRSLVDDNILRRQTEKKIKGYFHLAKVEIGKAVQADEKDIVEDAIKHYESACAILNEGTSIPVTSESGFASMYVEKMLNWQKDVDERLQVLSSVKHGKVEEHDEVLEHSSSSYGRHGKIHEHGKALEHSLSCHGKHGMTGEHDKVLEHSSSSHAKHGNIDEHDKVLEHSSSSHGKHGKIYEHGKSQEHSSSSNVNHGDVHEQNSSRKHPVGSKASTAMPDLSVGEVKGHSSTKTATYVGKNHGITRPVSGQTSSSEAHIPKGVDSNLAKMIEDEIVDRTLSVSWDSIAGLQKAKQALMEMVILPIRRSDLFSGLRNPARGLLLFGPPGNGKTLLAKAVASESAATFFCVGASSLTSKWVGEGEKLMKALFAIARARQPSVVFIDEIDSIMSMRGSNEHEASRRLKSEFLVQFDGVMSNKDDQVVVMGATNRPQDIDDAVRRRLVKRIYIPLPDMDTRIGLLSKVLTGKAYSLPTSDIERIAAATEDYSGSDLYALCQEAAMAPIRELGTLVNTVDVDQVRSLTYHDFEAAMNVIRASVANDQLKQFEEWNEEFGSK